LHKTAYRALGCVLSLSCRRHHNNAHNAAKIMAQENRNNQADGDIENGVMAETKLRAYRNA